MALAAALFIAAAGMIFAGGSKDSGDAKGYKIAWSTIYLIPSWQQQTGSFIQKQIDKYKAQGLVAQYSVANANNDVQMQIQQIENLIAQKYDAIILIAGDAAALNPSIEKAHKAGIVVVNIDSLASTNQMTSKINTSGQEYGELCARFVIDKLGGAGNVIIFNGPAGNPVAEDRRAGAKSVLAKYPNVKLLTELYSHYSEGPAMEVVGPALDANKNVDGIISLGGAQSSAALKTLQDKKMKLIPISSENYNAYLKEWARLKPQGFSSFAVAQPNWLGTLAAEQCMRALQGQKVNPNVIVPLPKITDDDLKDFVPNTFADDYWAVKELTDAQINDFLKF
jgi:ribose transport system substrate-binding protein